VKSGHVEGEEKFRGGRERYSGRTMSSEEEDLIAEETEEEVMMDQPEEEDEHDVGLRKRRSRRRSSQEDSRKEEKKRNSENQMRKTEDAGRYLRGILALLLVAYLALDMLVLGLRGGSSGFVDWWDMVGTVAYVRGRHSNYALRKRYNQTSFAWAAFLLLDAFVLYEIAGKTVRTIMRHHAVLPSVKGFADFVVYGFLPVHFFPGDHFFELLEHNNIHQLIVCLFWGATKTRSVYKQIYEAVNVHDYNFVQAFLICLLSCEVASVVSRIDKNVNVYPFSLAVQRWPGGMQAWLTSRTFMSSIFISVFTYLTVKTINIPVVWMMFISLTFVACFYRYGNGLVERVIDENIVQPRLERLAQDGAEEESEEEEEEKEKEKEKEREEFKLPLDLQSLKAKNVRRALKGLEERLQGLAQELPVQFQTKAGALPSQVAGESKHLAEALRLVLEQLNKDAIQDAEIFQQRLEEITAELDSNAKNLTADLSTFGKDLAERGRKLKIT